MNRSTAFERLKAAMNEFEAVRFCIERVHRTVVSDPTTLANPDLALRPSDLRESLRNLEVTYALRLFAEFEAVLRDYWGVKRPIPRPRHTRIEILLNRVASYNNIDTTTVASAHAVREYRNDIVHDRLRTPRFTIHDCKSRLATFLSYLPVSW
ncbi:MAG TPA: hypothetical protein VG722_07900 [Tepidisphaeraceae bacterium]|nr:hypothetical protein [Tepidisphaeraceae bacterium]